MVLDRAWLTPWSPSWVLPRDLEGQRCFPPPPLPTAGSLSASPMPYAWAHCHRICNTRGCPHAHTPTPGSPWTPKAAAAMPSL